MEVIFMLSSHTIATIKSTVPVLEIHGTEITKRFYHMLFTNHPELFMPFTIPREFQFILFLALIACFW